MQRVKSLKAFFKFFLSFVKFKVGFDDEFGLFVERKEIKHTSDLAKLSDVELLEVLVKEAEEAQVLLEYHGGDAEDGTDNS